MRFDAKTAKKFHLRVLEIKSSPLSKINQTFNDFFYHLFGDSYLVYFPKNSVSLWG